MTKSINNVEMFTLFMKPALQGVWQFICHVANHLGLGMQALYQVHPQDAYPLPALTSAKISPRKIDI
jgi:hypothetical protein